MGAPADVVEDSGALAAIPTETTDTVAKVEAGRPTAPASEVPSNADETLRHTDILGTLGPTFQLDKGLDVIVTKEASGRAGVTVWAQNPYEVPLTLDVSVSKDQTSFHDRVTAHLAALEVGLLQIPVRRPKGSTLHVLVQSEKTDVARVREATPGSYDVVRTAFGMAAGLATLLGTGVGHFSWARRGGRADNPLSLKFDIGSESSWAVPIDYRRLWAPAAAPPSQEITVTRRTQVGRELTSLGWLAIVGAGALGYYTLGVLIAPQLDSKTLADLGGASVFGWIGAIAAGVAMAVLIKGRSIQRLSRPAESILGMGPRE